MIIYIIIFENIIYLRIIYIIIFFSQKLINNEINISENKDENIF